MGEDGVEPPELLSNRFTVCPATSTEYSPITRKPRVSNMFIVLCFPLGCFMPCQSHGVVSEDYSWKVSWKLFVVNVHSLATYSTQRQYRTGSCFFNPATPLRTFWKATHIHTFGSFFSIHKTDGQLWEKWKLWGSNPGPTGYEPVTLTSWAKLPE